MAETFLEALTPEEVTDLRRAAASGTTTRTSPSSTRATTRAL